MEVTTNKKNTVSERSRRYDSYKDSGIEWLGDIPEHWEVKKMKFIGDVFAGISGKKGEDFSKEYSKGIKSFIPFTNICNNLQIDENQYQFVKIDVKENQNRVKKNDILFLMSSETLDDIAKCSIYLGDDEELYLNSFCKGFRISKNDINPEYINYLLSSQIYRNYFSLVGRGFTRINLKQEFINDASVSLPPLSEQTAIANFLDDKTTKIDEAIAIKEQQIQLLKERKQILIHKAITQGIRSLSEVEMKDSGVEWIGEIPEHWEVKRVKHILNERTERSKDGKEPLLMMSQIHGLVVRSEFHSKVEVAQNNEGNKIVKKNDLVFNKLKAHLGVFFKSNIDFEGIVSPDYAVYNSKGIISDLKFLELLFRSPEYIKEFICRATGIVEGLIRLYTSDLFDIHVAVPPITEQNEILSYIEETTNKIETAISLKQQEIAKLKEYKNSLINSVVTGKVRVC